MIYYLNASTPTCFKYVGPLLKGIKYENRQVYLLISTYLYSENFHF